MPGAPSEFVFERRESRLCWIVHAIAALGGLWLAAAFLVVISAVAWARQAPPVQSPAPSRTAQAQTVLESLLAKDVAKIVAEFDATMKGALTEQALRGDMPGYDYRELLAGIEGVMTALGVMPFEEASLPPEDHATF